MCDNSIQDAPEAWDLRGVKGIAMCGQVTR